MFKKIFWHKKEEVTTTGSSNNNIVLYNFKNEDVKEYKDLSRNEKQLVNLKRKYIIKKLVHANTFNQLSDEDLNKKIRIIQDLEINNMFDFDSSDISIDIKSKKIIKALIYLNECKMILNELEYTLIALNSITELNLFLNLDRKYLLVSSYIDEVQTNILLVKILIKSIKDVQNNYVYTYYSDNYVIDSDRIIKDYQIIFDKNPEEINNINELCFTEYQIEMQIYNNKDLIQKIEFELSDENTLDELFNYKNKLFVMQKYSRNLVSDKSLEKSYDLIFKYYYKTNKINEFSKYYSFLNDDNIKEKEFYQSIIDKKYNDLINKKSKIFDDKNIKKIDDIISILSSYIKGNEYNADKIIKDNDKLTILLSLDSLDILKNTLLKMTYLKEFLLYTSKVDEKENDFVKLAKIMPIIFDKNSCFFNDIPNRNSDIFSGGGYRNFVWYINNLTAFNGVSRNINIHAKKNAYLNGNDLVNLNKNTVLCFDKNLEELCISTIPVKKNINYNIRFEVSANTKVSLGDFPKIVLKLYDGFTIINFLDFMIYLQNHLSLGSNSYVMINHYVYNVCNMGNFYYYELIKKYYLQNKMNFDNVSTENVISELHNIIYNYVYNKKDWIFNYPQKDVLAFLSKCKLNLDYRPYQIQVDNKYSEIEVNNIKSIINRISKINIRNENQQGKLINLLIRCNENLVDIHNYNSKLINDNYLNDFYRFLFKTFFCLDNAKSFVEYYKTLENQYEKNCYKKIVMNYYDYLKDYSNQECNSEKEQVRNNKISKILSEFIFDDLDEIMTNSDKLALLVAAIDLNHLRNAIKNIDRLNEVIKKFSDDKFAKGIDTANDAINEYRYVKLTGILPLIYTDKEIKEMGYSDVSNIIYTAVPGFTCNRYIDDCNIDEPIKVRGEGNAKIDMKYILKTSGDVTFDIDNRIVHLTMINLSYIPSSVKSITLNLNVGCMFSCDDIKIDKCPKIYVMLKNYRTVSEYLTGIKILQENISNILIDKNVFLCCEKLDYSISPIDYDKLIDYYNDYPEKCVGNNSKEAVQRLYEAYISQVRFDEYYIRTLHYK